MPDQSPVERLFYELDTAAKLLGEKMEISAQLTVQDQARKAILLAAASHFEHVITGQIRDLARRSATGTTGTLLAEFVLNKAISRQYHSLFQWTARNANAFFGLFGVGFKDWMKAKVKAEPKLDAAIRAFLELGDLRNQLVHQDYASFSLDKTVDEIFDLYHRAEGFVGSLPRLFDEAPADLAPPSPHS